MKNEKLHRWFVSLLWHGGRDPFSLRSAFFTFHFSFFILIKPVVGISAQTGERLRFDSLLEAAEFLYAQGETSSVVAAQLIISQVCNGHRRTGFGYYWEFPHRGRPMTLATRKGGRSRVLWGLK